VFALIPTTPTQLGTQATPPGQRWLYGIPSTQRRILSVWGGEDKSVREFIDLHMWSVCRVSENRINSSVIHQVTVVGQPG
jgi:hypothetical protein